MQSNKVNHTECISLLKENTSDCCIVFNIKAVQHSKKNKKIVLTLNSTHFKNKSTYHKFCNHKISMSDEITIYLKRRGGLNTLDAIISRSFKETAKFDMDLITSDGKKVSVHRSMVTILSKYVEKELDDFSADGIIVRE